MATWATHRNVANPRQPRKREKLPCDSTNPRSSTHGTLHTLLRFQHDLNSSWAGHCEKKNKGKMINKESRIYCLPLIEKYFLVLTAAFPRRIRDHRCFMSHHSRSLFRFVSPVNALIFSINSHHTGPFQSDGRLSWLLAADLRSNATLMPPWFNFYGFRSSYRVNSFKPTVNFLLEF